MMKNRPHRHDINSPRSRHIVQELPQYDDGYMLEATSKQHLKLNS